eukprot:TRINITY_DN1754_c0_g1_i1.p1 TRINITY_DN1754_c0_g1~~TRINITY_DN1754_c0_g1_i1.p1  ORF type:complete len:263 (-),score=69.64 TRINITY_DN1754_c0_g1_i1:41-829(-)
MMNFESSTHCRLQLMTPPPESFIPYQSLSEKEKEKRNFFFMCSVMQRESGLASDLRERVIATSITYFKRYYSRTKVTDENPLVVIPACLFLAAKVEESFNQEIAPFIKKITEYRKSNIINFPSLYANKNDVALTEEITRFEYSLFDKMDGCLVVYHPHKYLPKLIEDAGITDPSHIEAINRMTNETLLTDAVLYYSPQSIAIGAMLCASVLLNFDIGKWLSGLKISLKEPCHVSQMLLDTLQMNKLNFSIFETLIQKRTQWN